MTQTALLDFVNKKNNSILKLHKKSMLMLFAAVEEITRIHRIQRHRSPWDLGTQTLDPTRLKDQREEDVFKHAVGEFSKM